MVGTILTSSTSSAGATARTLFLFAILTGIFILVGFFIGGAFIGDAISGMIFFLAIASVINIFAYFFSDRIVLWSYRAKIVSKEEAPKLYKIVERVAMKADIPMPKIAIIPTENPNAFATGRSPKNAVVAATDGILKLLNDSELEGVIAHEIAHVRNRDILIMCIAATIVGAISFAARMLWFNAMFGRRGRDSGSNPILLLIVGITLPIAALLIRLAISRSQEYKADATGAKILNNAYPLADALEKLEYANKKKPLNFGNPSSSSLFIVNPFGGSSIVSLFSTHPPIEKRVKRLREMTF
jgi:heat shock protein HtpX